MDADTPAVREKHAHGCAKEIGATVPEIDPRRRAIGPQERGQGTSEGGSHEAAGAVKDEGEANGGRGADAGRQQVEAVKQVEAVDQHDTRDHHERDANPTREVEGHRHRDDRSHAELGRKSQRRRKPEAVVGDPYGQGRGQWDQNDRPTDRHTDHKAGKDGDSPR